MEEKKVHIGKEITQQKYKNSFRVGRGKTASSQVINLKADDFLLIWIRKNSKPSLTVCYDQHESGDNMMKARFL